MEKWSLTRMGLNTISLIGAGGESSREMGFIRPGVKSILYGLRRVIGNGKLLEMAGSTVHHLREGSSFFGAALNGYRDALENAPPSCCSYQQIGAPSCSGVLREWVERTNDPSLLGTIIQAGRIAVNHPVRMGIRTYHGLNSYGDPVYESYDNGMCGMEDEILIDRGNQSDIYG